MTKSPFTLGAIVTLILLLGSPCAFPAPGKGKAKGKTKAKAKSSAPAKGKDHRSRKKEKIKSRPGKEDDLISQEWRAQARFHDRDRAVFHTHFQKYKRHPHGLPPGLAKNLHRGKPLPPGWHQKLREGWIIDDSWWGHFQPVPAAHLPSGLHYPLDTGIYLFGDRLVRVHRPSREVIDLIRIASIVLGN